MNTTLAKKTKIIASNDINLDFVKYLSTIHNELDILGIGTNVGTFSILKPIGFVYKLCQVEERGTSKKSNEIKKSYLPFKKSVYRSKVDDQVFFIQTAEDEEIKEHQAFAGFIINTTSN